MFSIFKTLASPIAVHFFFLNIICCFHLAVSQKVNVEDMRTDAYFLNCRKIHHISFLYIITGVFSVLFWFYFLFFCKILLQFYYIIIFYRRIKGFVPS